MEGQNGRHAFLPPGWGVLGIRTDDSHHSLRSSRTRTVNEAAPPPPPPPPAAPHSLAFLHSPRTMARCFRTPPAPGVSWCRQNTGRGIRRVRGSCADWLRSLPAAARGEQWCSIRLTARADNVTRRVQSRSSSRGVDAGRSGAAEGVTGVPGSWSAFR